MGWRAGKFETHKKANRQFQGTLTCISIAKPVILVCQVKDQRETKHSAPSKSSLHSSFLKETLFYGLCCLKHPRTQRCLIIFIMKVLFDYPMTKKEEKLTAVVYDSVWSPASPVPCHRILASLLQLRDGGACALWTKECFDSHSGLQGAGETPKLFLFLPLKEGKGHPKCHIFLPLGQVAMAAEPQSDGGLTNSAQDLSHQTLLLLSPSAEVAARRLPTSAGDAPPAARLLWPLPGPGTSTGPEWRLKAPRLRRQSSQRRRLVVN